MRFRRAEDENHPLRRFFQRFQKRIEGFRRDLVRFVDDENFVSIARRTVSDVLAQLAHLVDAAIRGRVDFDDVDAAAGSNFFTTCALATRLGGRPVDAVQAPGDDSGDGGFSRTSLTRKNVAVRDALERDRIGERCPNVLLADKFGKGRRPVFARDDLVHELRNEAKSIRKTKCQTPGNPRHTNRTATVASFRTWRGLRPSIARSPRPDKKLV